MSARENYHLTVALPLVSESSYGNGGARIEWFSNKIVQQGIVAGHPVELTDWRHALTRCQLKHALLNALG